MFAYFLQISLVARFRSKTGCCFAGPFFFGLKSCLVAVGRKACHNVLIIQVVHYVSSHHHLGPNVVLLISNNSVHILRKFSILSIELYEPSELLAQEKCHSEE